MESYNAPRLIQIPKTKFDKRAGKKSDKTKQKSSRRLTGEIITPLQRKKKSFSQRCIATPHHSLNFPAINS